MSRPARRALPVALTAAVVALSAAAPNAMAAPVGCNSVSLPSVDGGSWKLQNDGSLAGSVQTGVGSVGDVGHGALKVAGVAYPNVEQNCDKTGSVVTFPSKNLGGLIVSRSVSVAGSRLRWVDTVRNPAAVSKPVDLDFALEVLPSQLITATESGDDRATDEDHFTLHKSTGAFSFHRWGQESQAIDPEVVPEDGGPGWEDDAGDMDDDAVLHYGTGAPSIGPGGQIRFLHVTGTSKVSQADILADAKDGAAAFTGYSKAIAAQVVNWGPDPDADGVAKNADDCPSVKGDQPNGCKLGLADPPPAADPVPPAPQPGDPAPQPADPAPQPGDPVPAPGDPVPAPGNPSGNGTGTGTGSGSGTGATSGTAVGTGAPKATVVVPKRVRRVTLTRGKGQAVFVTCSRTCRISASLAVRRGAAKRFTTIKTVKAPTFTTSGVRRTVRLRVSQAALLKARPGARIVVKVTDQQGRSTTITRAAVLAR